MTEAEIRVLEAMGEKFPNAWHGESPQIGEENARIFSIKCGRQLRYSFPDRNFGVKKADNGRPISKDSVARKDGDLIESWDIISGAGTGRGTFDPRHADYHDISDQVFVEVEPFNYLDKEEEPTEPTRPVPISNDTLEVILRDLNTISRIVNEIQSRVLKSGDRVAIRLENGMYISVQDADRPMESNRKLELQTRSSGTGGFEVVTLEKRDG